MNSKTIEWEILLVEDNLGDVRLIEEYFKTAATPVRLHTVGDGDGMLAFLRHEGRHAEAPRPDLILLDVNLPGADGLEILAEIKGNEDLRAIPVIVLSTGAADDAVREAYDRHANCYISKPVTFEEVSRILAAIERFWLHLVRLPRRQWAALPPSA